MVPYLCIFFSKMCLTSLPLIGFCYFTIFILKKKIIFQHHFNWRLSLTPFFFSNLLYKFFLKKIKQNQRQRLNKIQNKIIGSDATSTCFQDLHFLFFILKKRQISTNATSTSILVCFTFFRINASQFGVGSKKNSIFFLKKLGQ